MARRHDRLPVYGAGRNRPTSWWRRLLDHLVRSGLVRHDPEHGGLSLTKRGEAVLAGSERVTAPAEKAVAVRPGRAIEYDAVLFEQLRQLRRELAADAGVPPYVIFSDRTLAEMATFFPASPHSLLAVHGIGEHKAAQYGAAFLAAIRTYCSQNGLAERPRPANRPPVPVGRHPPAIGGRPVQRGAHAG